MTQTIKAIKKQPQRIRDLEKKEIKRKEAYRCLKVLKDSELIKELNGEYTWVSDLQEFENAKEYDTKLNHSKNLVKQAIAEGAPNEFNIDLYNFMDSYNFSSFLQHLKTGYPGIYKLYVKVEENNSEMEKLFPTLLQKIKEGALERGVELSKYPDNSRDLQKEIDQMPEKIFYSLKEYLNYFFDKDRKICYSNKDTKVSFPVYSEEKRKEFIEYCSHSEDIKKLHSELVELTKARAKDYAYLNIEIKSVVIKVVEDGEPLRGSCNRCPKVTIGRKLHNCLPEE
jgi:rubrerythrin